jgi:hypothetical protein
MTAKFYRSFTLIEVLVTIPILGARTAFTRTSGLYWSALIGRSRTKCWVWMRAVSRTVFLSLDKVFDPRRGLDDSVCLTAKSSLAPKILGPLTSGLMVGGGRMLMMISFRDIWKLLKRGGFDSSSRVLHSSRLAGPMCPPALESQFCLCAADRQCFSETCKIR